MIEQEREKRVKSAPRCERERNGENERAIQERTGKKERGTVSPRQENGGVPARTLNLLNALARA